MIIEIITIILFVILIVLVIRVFVNIISGNRILHLFQTTQESRDNITEPKKKKHKIIKDDENEDFIL